MQRFIALFAVGLLALAASCGGDCSQGAPAPGAAAKAGFSSQRLARLNAGMQKYVDGGLISGVVTLVHRRGRLVHSDVLGWQDVEQQRPMQRETIFRIYSMTKPITSAAVLMLLEEGKLRLTDPVDQWLPELKNPRVLRAPAGPLANAAPAKTPITVRDLLTHTSGLAYSFTAEGPLKEALEKSGVRGANEKIGSDEAMKILGELPLAYEPGTRWHYSLSTDVLGVLVARVSGMPFAEFLRQRIFDPLGMEDTAFWVPEAKLPRFAVNYALDPKSGKRVIVDHPDQSTYAEPPAFTSGGGGLVSTADDYLRFARMILAGGVAADGTRLLSRKTVELMTRNALFPEERPARNAFGERFFFAGRGFGLGVAVVEDPGLNSSLGSVGQNGWGGAAGTWYFVDPQEDLAAVLMIQLMQRGSAVPIREDFEALVYQAIAD